MDKTEIRELILSKIEQPRIPARDFTAAEFGIRPDTEDIQTEQLQAAIDAVSAVGGGRLVLPAGRYRTGALRLKSGVELHLAQEDTVLAFVTEEPERHYPTVFTHWEATPCYNYSPLVYACEACDVALTGKGKLDGGADAQHWWSWHHEVEEAWSEDKPDLQLADRAELRRMNADGVPVEERVFGPGHYLRPYFVQLIRCERILLAGVTLVNSPMWQVNPVMCRSVTVDGMTMSSHGSNNDGCDPESCCGVWIRNCRFDTGDDCISLKSGRDRDGRLAAKPCEYVLIEQNDFADGHGGVALGSEMSGGIRYVLATGNHFSSPNLTYALRLKTNARRGGRVEEIILADSTIDHVGGAAVHGTMLYEDGRNGTEMPVFENITIENVTAHGGDYGIFLEAFDEVPIRGLTLKNITIDGAQKMMRSMNWEHPVIENVTINGKRFPRPSGVRITDIPAAGKTAHAAADACTDEEVLRLFWRAADEAQRLAGESGGWQETAADGSFAVPADAAWVQTRAVDAAGNEECSIWYRVLRTDAEAADEAAGRLYCRGILAQPTLADGQKPATRGWLAGLLAPLAAMLDGDGAQTDMSGADGALRLAVEKGFLATDASGELRPEGGITRQEMGTVAMQACGVNYRNASSTMPVCTDVSDVNNNYGTNVARSLYFGFMELEADGRFLPRREVTQEEAVVILNRAADFARI